MYNFYEFRQIFGFEYSRKLYSEAIKARDQQIALWKRMIYETRIAIQGSPENDLYSAYLENLERLIEAEGSNIFNVSERDQEYVVSGSIPLIFKFSEPLSGFISLNPAKSFAVIYAETSQYAGCKLDINFVQIPPRIAMLAAVYMGEKSDPILKDITEMQKAVDSFRSKIQKMEIEMESKRNVLAESLKTEYSLLMQNFSASSKEIMGSHEVEKSDWAEFTKKSREDIESAKKLAFENEALKAARDVWAVKLHRHRLGYWSGLIGLALTIFIMVAYYFYKTGEIQEMMIRLRKPDGDLPYSLLLMYVIPIIAVGWILRMFGRFVNSSMVLTEDAEQRQAMLDTYFRLVGDPAARMEPTDRVLILNAIFRPLPGQQSEDVSPPSLLDLAQNAVSKK